VSGAADAALITRPRDDAEDLAKNLAERGFRPLIEPLLDISFRRGPALSRDNLQGLLVTSANGVRALAARLGPDLAAWRALPVWAVGDASARTARAFGFARVESADGDVASLARLVAAKANPGNGKLLQAAASDLAGDLAGALGGAGFTIDKQVLYDAIPAAALSAECQDELRRGRVAVALFFSPRTAAAFVRLASGDLGAACADITAAALSAAVAAQLAPLAWRKILLAAEPRQTALLAALDGV
jgi:uroporphyrinogen-III synthase